MLIWNIFPRMGPPSGALRECQPGSPRVAYRHMSNPVHHAQARVGSTRSERDPLQLVEHSGDAAGVVPAIAHIRAARRCTISNFCVLQCVWGSHTAEAYSKCGLTKAW